MHGVGPGAQCSLNQQIGPEVGVGWRFAWQPDRRVGLGDVRRAGVGVGVDGDGG